MEAMSDHPEMYDNGGPLSGRGRSGGMAADSEDDDVLAAAKAQTGTIIDAVTTLAQTVNSNYALHREVAQGLRSDVKELSGQVDGLSRKQELTTRGLKEVNDQLASLSDTVTSGFASLRASMDAKVDHARAESKSLTNEVRAEVQAEVKTIKTTQGTWLRISKFVEKHEKKAQWLAFIVIAFGGAVLNKACHQ